MLGLVLKFPLSLSPPIFPSLLGGKLPPPLDEILPHMNETAVATSNIGFHFLVVAVSLRIMVSVLGLTYTCYNNYAPKFSSTLLCC